MSAASKGAGGLAPVAAVFALFAMFAGAEAMAFHRTMTCDDDNPSSVFACREGETPIPVAWPDRCLTYRVHEDGLSDLEMTDYLHEVDLSFDTWNRVESANVTVRFAGMTDQAEVGYDGVVGADGNANVVVAREDIWPHIQSPGSNDIIALTSVTYNPGSGVIFDADVELNAAGFTFAVHESENIASGMPDLRNTLTHEVGHFLGLAHTDEENFVGNPEMVNRATMYATTRPGHVHFRSLTADDIAGITDAYPAGGDADCPTPEPSFLSSPQGFTPGRPAPAEKGCGRCSSTRPKSPPVGTLIVIALLYSQRRRR